MKEKLKTEKYECDECHCNFDCKYYIEENGDKVMMPDYATLKGEEPLFFCTKLCKDSFISRGAGLNKSDIKKIIDNLDKDFKDK